MATTPNRNWPTPDDTDLVRDGAAAIRALGDAIDGTVGQGFVFAGTRYYESSGQFLKADPLGTGDIGLRAIRVRLVGGGGGGGGTGVFTNAAGGGGGGGVYAESFITDIPGLDTTVTVTRAGGGTGGLGDTNGGSGGTSSFGALVSATGGTGGSRGFANDALGPPAAIATAGVGDLLIAGGVGGFGNREAPTVPYGGPGGMSGFGLGGRFTLPNQNGVTGGGFGSGGSGAANISAVARNGGNGATGIVIVDCFV